MDDPGELLRTAAANGDWRTVSKHIRGGTPLNEYDLDDYFTALMEASIHGRVLCVALLLQAGADMSIFDIDDLTARDHAVERGRDEVVALLDGEVLRRARDVGNGPPTVGGAGGGEQPAAPVPVGDALAIAAMEGDVAEMWLNLHDMSEREAELEAKLKREAEEKEADREADRQKAPQEAARLLEEHSAKVKEFEERLKKESKDRETLPTEKPGPKKRREMDEAKEKEDLAAERADLEAKRDTALEEAAKAPDPPSQDAGNEERTALAQEKVELEQKRNTLFDRAAKLGVSITDPALDSFAADSEATGPGTDEVTSESNAAANAAISSDVADVWRLLKDLEVREAEFEARLKAKAAEKNKGPADEVEKLLEELDTREKFFDERIKSEAKERETMPMEKPGPKKRREMDEAKLKAGFGEERQGLENKLEEAKKSSTSAEPVVVDPAEIEERGSLAEERKALEMRREALFDVAAKAGVKTEDPATAADATAEAPASTETLAPSVPESGPIAALRGSVLEMLELLKAFNAKELEFEEKIKAQAAEREGGVPEKPGPKKRRELEEAKAKATLAEERQALEGRRDELFEKAKKEGVSTDVEDAALAEKPSGLTSLAEELDHSGAIRAEASEAKALLAEHEAKEKEVEERLKKEAAERESQPPEKPGPKRRREADETKEKAALESSRSTLEARLKTALDAAAKAGVDLSSEPTGCDAAAVGSSAASQPGGKPDDGPAEAMRAAVKGAIKALEDLTAREEAWAAQLKTEAEEREKAPVEKAGPMKARQLKEGKQQAALEKERIALEKSKEDALAAAEAAGVDLNPPQPPSFVLEETVSEGEPAKKTKHFVREGGPGVKKDAARLKAENAALRVLLGLPPEDGDDSDAEAEGELEVVAQEEPSAPAEPLDRAAADAARADMVCCSFSLLPGAPHFVFQINDVDDDKLFCHSGWLLVG